MENDPKEPHPLEEGLGHRFSDPELLALALTHRSRVHEEGGEGFANERLEFLGDAVLDLVVSELLMEAQPNVSEGQLSRARAELVNGRSLADQARRLGLGDWVRLGRGEASSAGQLKASILSNVFEAVLGAMYLDGGLEPVRALVLRRFQPLFDDPSLFEADPKTRLQERLQTLGHSLPVYQTVAESGPDHAKRFHVEVSASDRVLGSGIGSSKRDAEQGAAREALVALDTPEPGEEGMS